ncbi:hypothetical protein ICM_06268 [Bacillus cereus BAG1X2-3]|uniref:M23 family peptidase n=1 Tax=Bacillus cereus TaxID=1396 RepID=A0A9X7E1W4_BACCE|nr:M23 family metallopeptidase [Bacillus cereus]EOO23045.1 hypothetical protein ICC_06415 [Bacillus cereus BAG1X1-1]EOO42825.1 hypothetical protein ICI_06332 [Bacillus cereus BAG1X2-1]EOO43935.1 hypothetical protein ICK_06628 [Bacillus cereus BAG1X2-2]EOO55967.1 hypothetical protein ICM_06268 [Bacillus cereus BAG1X2-3]EOO99907.1 hypothetical protein ICO_06679 [Bacillus cereus BAG2O-1]
MAGQTHSYDSIGFSICSDPNKCSLVRTQMHIYSGTPLIGIIQSLQGCGLKHLGALDINVPGIGIGTPVYAAESGKINVLSFGWESCGCQNICNSANLVSIRSDVDNFITQYVHVSPLPSIKLGDYVHEGQQIGTVDLSGSSCQPHVHMARYTPTGSPTCDWSIRPLLMIFYPGFFDHGVLAHPSIHSSGVYHPSIPPIPRSHLY